MTRSPFRRAIALALSLILGVGAIVATAPAAYATPVIDAALSGLTLSEGTLSPGFDPATTSYTATVNSLYVNITPTFTAGNTVTVQGAPAASGSPSQVTLPYGQTSGISIMVTAADNTSTNYIINITRPAAPAPTYNLDLSGLAISPGILSPAFSSAVTSYTVDVPYETTSMTFTPGTSAGNTVTLIATMAVVGTTVALAASGTAVFVTVTAPDSTSRVYVVTVTRGPAPTANVDLDDLELSIGTLNQEFDPAVQSYTATVPYAVRSMQITATASTSGHTMTINNQPITDGVPATVPVNFGPTGNGFAIAVKAANGVEKIYVVTITRDQPSNNADLTSLSLSNGTLSPAFSNTETAYTATVPYLTTSTSVTSTVADATAILRVNGRDTASGAAAPIVLAVGANTITVAATAEDGVTTTTRTIIVTRTAPELDLSALTVTGGTLSPAFDADTTSYALALPYPVTSIDIAAAAVETDWALAIQGVETSAKTVAVPVGASTITVTVTALHGESRSYTIALTRQAPSSNATLSGITLSNGALSPAFSSGARNYTTTVAYLTKEITLGASAADATANMTINGQPATSTVVPLVVGENTITIVTTAQDGLTKITTTVVVTRQVAPNPEIDIDLGFAAGDKATDAPFNVVGTKLLPGSTATVTMHSTPIVLASGIVLADGTVVLNARIPAGAQAGAHRLVFEGTSMDGTPVTSTAWFTVLRNGTIGAASLTAPVAYIEPAALVRTGADSATAAAFGGGIVAIGALLLMLGAALRRRRSVA